ncbi:sugar ABC transporter permease [Agrobacterium tumefaciens]|uniref:carbohydrate ABC transporter permease n=1 Tax=Agrobacterium tumefaciens TaxID=358 RepID=UPI001573EB1F|nr:sugar ABC transporter permease [Agrobacterium tumefaciens]NTE65132.1 sugar ABC transporter permease [Agrobacterium tumefaciens]
MTLSTFKAPAGARENPRRTAVLREHAAAVALGGPALVLLLVLFILPVIAVFAIALTDWQFGAPAIKFIGFGNFQEMIGDDTVRQSLWNTFAYVALVVPGTVAAGLTVALLIESGQSFRAFYRAAHFLPFMATLSAMAIAWEGLLHPTAGLLNQVLVAIGFAPANWLRNSATVLPVLAFLGIWRNLGFAMVIFLAGMKSIPRDLYEAADIDGADGWFERLTTVTLPLLGPVTMVVVIVTALRAFETFDVVKILTQGGPAKASEMLLYTIYTESFEFMRTGYGAAVAVVFLVIVLALTLLQSRVFDKRVHYS